MSRQGSENQLPLSCRKRKYEELLEEKELSDISFEVEGELFYAHKLILANRSPVFRSQFLGPLRDVNVQSIIKVEDMQAHIFKALLHFIYCDVLADYVDAIMKRDLLVAADRYGIETLKSLCGYIDIDNLGSTLAIAVKHDCSQLKSRCFDFIVPENMEAIFKTDGFRNLSKNCPAALFELVDDSCSRSRRLHDAKARGAK